MSGRPFSIMAFAGLLLWTTGGCFATHRLDGGRPEAPEVDEPGVDGGTDRDAGPSPLPDVLEKLAVAYRECQLNECDCFREVGYSSRGQCLEGSVANELRSRRWAQCVQAGLDDPTMDIDPDVFCCAAELLDDRAREPLRDDCAVAGMTRSCEALAFAAGRGECAAFGDPEVQLAISCARR